MKLVSMVLLCTTALSIPYLGWAKDTMAVKSCQTTSNFKIIQKECMVMTSKVIPVKRCQQFGDLKKPVCHWTQQPVQERNSRMIKRQRNPYVNHSPMH